MSGRVRIEVERFDATGLHTSYALNVDPPALDDATQQWVNALVDGLIADAKALGIPDPAMAIGALLVEQLGDQRAYEREAQRRGVLAL